MRFFLSSFVNVPELACCRRSGGGEGLNRTRGENERRLPSFLVNFSPALLVLAERLEQAMPKLVQFSYHAQECKKKLDEGRNLKRHKTVGVSSVKMSMLVILH